MIEKIKLFVVKNNRLNWYLSLLKHHFMILTDLGKYRKLYRETLTIPEKKVVDGDIKKYKKSDTVFVLGSGATINDLSKEDWEIIKKHDSISFNLFIVHNFIATYHFQEAPIKGSFRDKEISLLTQIMNDRSELYKNVPFIFRYRRFKEYGLSKSDFPESLQSNIHVILTLMANSFQISVVRFWMKLFKFMYKIGINRKFWSSIIYHAGSASYVTGFAHYAGYKKIVLLGIELNNQDYFWDTSKEENPYFEECKSLRKFLRDNFTVHMTADREAQKNWNNNIPVDEFLYLYNDTFLKPDDVKLYVGSNKSALYPKLELFDFKTI
jgi:hypothetical protein